VRRNPPSQRARRPQRLSEAPSQRPSCRHRRGELLTLEREAERLAPIPSRAGVLPSSRQERRLAAATQEILCCWPSACCGAVSLGGRWNYCVALPSTLTASWCRRSGCWRIASSMTTCERWPGASLMIGRRLR
jgi:hypothetical protein